MAVEVVYVRVKVVSAVMVVEGSKSEVTVVKAKLVFGNAIAIFFSLSLSLG